MSQPSSLFPVVATGITAFALVVAIFAFPELAAAGDRATPAPSCTCPDASQSSGRPKFAELRTDLDESDEVAALQIVQYALSEVADGSSYVWKRRDGQLSGIVNPTRSFKDGEGAVCRHVVVLLNSRIRMRKTEGVACRLASGVWRLDG